MPPEVVQMLCVGFEPVAPENRGRIWIQRGHVVHVPDCPPVGFSTFKRIPLEDDGEQQATWEPRIHVGAMNNPLRPLRWLDTRLIPRAVAFQGGIPERLLIEIQLISPHTNQVLRWTA